MVLVCGGSVVLGGVGSPGVCGWWWCRWGGGVGCWCWCVVGVVVVVIVVVVCVVVVVVKFRIVMMRR